MIKGHCLILFVAFENCIQQYIKTMKTNTTYYIYIHNMWSKTLVGLPGTLCLAGGKTVYRLCYYCIKLCIFIVISIIACNGGVTTAFNCTHFVVIEQW